MSKLANQFRRAADNLMIRLFSLFPLRRDRILLMSDGDFWDNTRAFYDYLIARGIHETAQIVWLVDHPEQHQANAPKNVKFVRMHASHPLPARDYYLATTACVIYTHQPPTALRRAGQVFIHTTHSASQLKASKSFLSRDKEKINLPDYQLRCGVDGVEKFKLGHAYKDEQYLVLGMPRLDQVFTEKDCITPLAPVWCGEKLILSMETFKKGGNFDDSDNDSDVFGINVIHSKDELLALNQFLSDQGYLLMVKPHHKQDLGFLEFLELDHILFVTDEQLRSNDIQLCELIGNCDVMLTDYSSVFYDFLLLDRPIGFMISDMEDYKRGFIVDDPLSEMPGEKLKTLEDLKSFLLAVKAGEDPWQSERLRIRDRVFAHQDDKNSERLYQWLVQRGVLQVRR